MLFRSAFSPKTGWYYFFAHESCTIYSKNDEWWEAGKSFYGGGTRRAPGDDGAKILKAVDIRTGKAAWEIPNIGGGILGSGLMVTAGGLVFYGDGRGAFVAADASNGKLLWHFNTGQNWRAGPMAYNMWRLRRGRRLCRSRCVRKRAGISWTFRP